MITSMTGFGRGHCSLNGFDTLVEVRSVNHRFLDISLRAPKPFESKEQEIRELIREYIGRGRVTVQVELKTPADESLDLKLNDQLAAGYYRLLLKLREIAQLEEPVTLDHLLSFEDIIEHDEPVELAENGWECAKKALHESLEALNLMRKREGEEIRKDLENRLDVLAEHIEGIEELAQNRAEDEFNRLKGRLETMLENGSLDPSRLEMEIAVLADRVDVTEECIRFKSHNTLFLESIEDTAPTGRKLNFLLQEMNREANTIGAKANHSEIAHLVVLIKEEVEKLREQIQNIE